MKTKIKAPEWFIDGMTEIHKHVKEQDRVLGENPLGQKFSSDEQHAFVIKEAISKLDQLGEDVIKYELRRKLFCIAWSDYLWAKLRFENNIVGDAEYLEETGEIEIDTTLFNKLTDLIDTLKDKLFKE